MADIINLPRSSARQAVILARVSSREQEEGHSIDAQKHRLLQYCQRRGLEVLQVFEITESSTRGDRAKFMQMISFCKKQRQTIAVVADKVDRVQRSFKEYPLLDSLVQEGRIELHFNTEGYVIHAGSASQERLMWSMGVIMAQSYVDSLRDNVRRSFDHKLRIGEYLGKAPLGYLNTRDAAGRSEMPVDPVRAPLIRRLFQVFAAGGMTLSQLLEQVDAWGLRNKNEGETPLHRSHLYAILNNPFYYGMMKVKGRLYPHRYETLTDKATWDACQAVLQGWNKKQFHYGEKDFIFRGLLTSANGRTVTADTKTKTYKNGLTASWTYLGSWDAAGKKYWVREDKILAQAQAALDAIKIPDAAILAVSAHLRGVEGEERVFHRHAVEELKRDDARLQQKLDGAMDLLMDGAISRDEFDRRRDQIRAQQADVAQRLALHRESDDGFKDALIWLMEMCRDVGKLFAGSNAADKRALLNFTLSNLRLDGESLCFDYRNPFGDFVETAADGRWLGY